MEQYWAQSLGLHIYHMAQPNIGAGIHKGSCRRALLCSPLWTCGGHIANGGIHGDISRSTYYNHRSRALGSLRIAQGRLKNGSRGGALDLKRKDREEVAKKNRKEIFKPNIFVLRQSDLLDEVMPLYEDIF